MSTHPEEGLTDEELVELPWPALAEDEINRLKCQLKKALKERDHWKSNHDNQVRLKQALADRPDLKERAASWQRLQKELEDARAELEKLKNENLPKN
jgi:uncharacterized small protein (DUF1192 family)